VSFGASVASNGREIVIGQGGVDSVAAGIYQRVATAGAAATAAAADGTIYASSGQTVVRLGPGGSVTRIAGGGSAPPADGEAATSMSIAPDGLALATDGSLLVSDGRHDEVLRVAGAADAPGAPQGAGDIAVARTAPRRMSTDAFAGYSGLASYFSMWYLAAADGGVFTSPEPPGIATPTFYGSAAGHPLDEPIVGIAANATASGYWLVARDGGVFAFGDAPFFGSAADQHGAPVVGMATCPCPPPPPRVGSPSYVLARRDGTTVVFGPAPTPTSVVPPVAGVAWSVDWPLVATATGEVYPGLYSDHGGDTQPPARTAPPGLDAPVVGIAYAGYTLGGP
jgi:hypothetical protein